jgi:hypothetical protein
MTMGWRPWRALQSRQRSIRTWPATTWRRSAAARTRSLAPADLVERFDGGITR